MCLRICFSASVATPPLPTLPTTITVVVDTNIFIAELVQLRRLMQDPDVGGSVVLYVPWAVNRELDNLKSRRRVDGDEEEDKKGVEKLARAARAAVR
jgi:rRNA-processing protein FCF1